MGTAEAVEGAEQALDTGINIASNSGSGGSSLSGSGGSSGGSSLSGSSSSLDLDVGEFDPTEEFNFIDESPVKGKPKIGQNSGGNPPRPGSGGSGINSGAETPDQVIQPNGGGGRPGRQEDIFDNMSNYGDAPSPQNASPPGSPPRPSNFNPNFQPRMKRW